MISKKMSVPEIEIEEEIMEDIMKSKTNRDWSAGKKSESPHGISRLPLELRGMIASTIIGVIYCIIIMRISLTPGLSPNLNVSVALLAFIFIKSLTKILEKTALSAPFTRQENTMIRTCGVACYSITISGLKPLTYRSN